MKTLHATMTDGTTLEWRADTLEIREFSPRGNNVGVTYGVPEGKVASVFFDTQHAITADEAVANV